MDPSTSDDDIPLSQKPRANNTEEEAVDENATQDLYLEKDVRGKSSRHFPKRPFHLLQF